jgi:hypothetical protein
MDDVLAALRALPPLLARLAGALDRPPVETLLTRKDFARVIRVSTAVFDRLRAGGKLPIHDMYISRSHRWRADTIRAWIERRGR